MVGGHFAKLVQCVYVGPAAVQSNGDVAVNLGRVILVLPFAGRKMVGQADWGHRIL